MQDRIIRTLLPYAIGWIASLLALLGYDLGAADQIVLGNALTFLFGAGYYIIVTLLAKKWPQIEWLLGSPNKPEYKDK